MITRRIGTIASSLLLGAAIAGGVMGDETLATNPEAEVNADCGNSVGVAARLADTTGWIAAASTEAADALSTPLDAETFGSGVIAMCCSTLAEAAAA